MKRFIYVVAAMLVAGAAQAACPELAGEYTCNVQGEISHRTVTQQNVNGITQYVITDDGNSWEPLVTDGVEHDFNNVQGMQEARYTATCENNELLVHMMGKIYDNGQLIGNMKLFVRAGLDSVGNILQNIKGAITGDFGEFPIEEQNNVCTRK